MIYGPQIRSATATNPPEAAACATNELPRSINCLWPQLPIPPPPIFLETNSVLFRAVSTPIPKESQFRFLDCFWPFFWNRFRNGCPKESYNELTRNWDSQFLILMIRHNTSLVFLRPPTTCEHAMRVFCAVSYILEQSEQIDRDGFCPFRRPLSNEPQDSIDWQRERLRLRETERD